MGFAADMRAEGRCNGTPAGDTHDHEEEETPMTAIPETAPEPTPIKRPTASALITALGIKKTSSQHRGRWKGFVHTMEIIQGLKRQKTIRV